MSGNGRSCDPSCGDCRIDELKVELKIAEEILERMLLCLRQHHADDFIWNELILGKKK